MQVAKPKRRLRLEENTRVLTAFQKSLSPKKFRAAIRHEVRAVTETIGQFRAILSAGALGYLDSI